MAREPRASGPATSTGPLIPRARTPVDQRRVDSVLDTKVSVPVPAMPVLPRPRLFDALTAASEHRVTVVNASAGAGKTLLLASWLSWSTNLRGAWVSFDRTDNEPKVFWSYLVEALRRACADREGSVFGDLAGSDLASDRFPERLLDALAELDEPVVLVIDQAHEITDWRLLTGLEFVLRHAPSTLRLIFSGRGLPAIPLARLRVAGDLADIGAVDLACTPIEAAELFALFDAPLDPSEIAGVLDRTEGWMAGLRLAGLWWQAQPGARRDPSEFTGEESLVADYLGDEVVGARSSRIRQFLLRTCVVDRVCAELADALTGETDGGETLDALERENALVTAVGSHRTWYRYGPLLREFLSHQLRREIPEEIPALHRQAARWFAHQGHVVEAARHAVAARDWALAGSLLVPDGYRALASGEATELDHLLARIPTDEVRANPDLAAVCAHARLSAADPDGAEAFLRIAEASSASAPAGGVRADDDGELARRLKVSEMRLHQACLRGRVDTALVTTAYALLDEARESGLAAASQHELGTVAYWLGISELWTGRTTAARAVLEQALPRLSDNGFTTWERLAHGWVALLNAAEGRLGAAERALAARPTTMQTSMAATTGGATSGAAIAGATPSTAGRVPVARTAPGAVPVRTGRAARTASDAAARVPAETVPTVPAAPMAGAADPMATLHGLARVLVDVERDRLDQAWTTLSALGTATGPAGSDNPAYPPLGELVGLLRARVLIHQGDLTAAKAELAGAKHAATRLGPHVEQYAALLDVEIQLHEGSTVRAREILAAAAAAFPHGRRAADAVAEGRLHLAGGDPAAALEAVTPCLSGTAAETRLLDTVAALLVAATAHRRLGTQAAATGFLERALTLAREDGLIRVFLDAGRGVRALLTVVIAPEGPHAGFRSSLLHRFDVQPAATWKSPEQSVRLTASERAVLRYLPSHLTNEEIAQDLCLSVNTVKSHLRTLYRKLGVTCRREAIARALQQELLR